MRKYKFLHTSRNMTKKSADMLRLMIFMASMYNKKMHCLFCLSARNPELYGRCRYTSHLPAEWLVIQSCSENQITCHQSGWEVIKAPVPSSTKEYVGKNRLNGTPLFEMVLPAQKSTPRNQESHSMHFQSSSHRMINDGLLHNSSKCSPELRIKHCTS